ncbi:hypothetical protein K469DRAFT_744443 [Zopfia rhizophila CBS 207.26]|uniref:Retrotransposon gag domain-containing protein n=1 Tax=Zopfia rhizophila CBS 207.26 TaxID=1314779 RepID=A0A6A6EX81_9PEZI|nr:hypothetical protein K469DRAFT_744443 [Zopfia rhizophila CBS 207.26]
MAPPKGSTSTSRKATQSPKAEPEDDESRNDYQKQITQLQKQVADLHQDQQQQKSQLNEILHLLQNPPSPSPASAPAPAPAPAHLITSAKRPTPNLTERSLSHPSNNHTREATARDIGYLDPQDNKEAVHSGEKQELVYTDVTLFNQKLNQIASRKAVYGDTIVACLRGKALTWFNSLSDQQNQLYDGSVDLWIQELNKQFGLKRQTALDNLLSTRYTVSDAKNQVELVTYLDRIKRYCRALGYHGSQQQDYVWRGMHAEIRTQFIDCQELSIEDLRNQFDTRQQLIWSLFKFKGPPQAPSSSRPSGDSRFSQQPNSQPTSQQKLLTYSSPQPKTWKDTNAAYMADPVLIEEEEEEEEEEDFESSIVSTHQASTEALINYKCPCCLKRFCEIEKYKLHVHTMYN